VKPMADERQTRRMHEALDDQLAPDELDALYHGLDGDQRDASLFERLRTVDRMLKEAPFEDAPQTLALRVLAKIAVLMPLFAALGWLIIQVLSNPAAAVSAVISVLGSLAGVILAAVQSVQAALLNSPLIPAALLGAIPAGLLLLRRLRGNRLERERRERLGTPPQDEE